ncbi:MAG: hypothetical protein JXA13_03670 [Anaerolineales bacterium]|nr:hypothetical protein [Anaerolineales bacterium]
MVALAANRLAEALKQPGCILCNHYNIAVIKYLDHFIYMSVNEPKRREEFVESLGFCPRHIHLMAKIETENYGEALGTTILYEHLSREIIKQIKDWKPTTRQSAALRNWLDTISNCLGLKRKVTRNTSETCRVCEIGEDAVYYAIPTFLNEYTRNPEEWQTGYKASDGLCLFHLRMIMDDFAVDYPEAARLLHEDALSRLEYRIPIMKSYITKHSYDKTDPLTQEERQTWKQTLTFFTGFSPETFIPFGDRKD